MSGSNFSKQALNGEVRELQDAVDGLYRRFGFDFVSMGLTAFVGAPLRWIYSAGETSNRHRRIALAPGHGIGGIVLKAGKPMLFTDIDAELDPREYSSYPIVFAEDLRSFCALPLMRGDHAIAVLLCAFRTVADGQERTFSQLIEHLGGTFCGLRVVADGFMRLEGDAGGAAGSADEGGADGAGAGASGAAGSDAGAGAVSASGSGASHLSRSEISLIITAQEEERRRISRELHDGVAQELLTATLSLQLLASHVDEEGTAALEEAHGIINGVLDELHNISVQLRPSALDHLGFVPALRSQALVLEKTYGSAIAFEGDLSLNRFAHALETQIYRICQEAMTNACKYSGSDVVHVRIEEAGEWLHVEVSDEGCGFDVEKPTIKGSGCGLLGMQERAALIGAALSLESGAWGTRVSLSAPMGGIEQGAGQDAGREAMRDAGQNAGQNALRESDREIGRDAGRETAHDAGQEAGHEAEQEGSR